MEAHLRLIDCEMRGSGSLFTLTVKQGQSLGGGYRFCGRKSEISREHTNATIDTVSTLTGMSDETHLLCARAIATFVHRIGTNGQHHYIEPKSSARNSRGEAPALTPTALSIDPRMREAMLD